MKNLWSIELFVNCKIILIKIKILYKKKKKKKNRNKKNKKNKKKVCFRKKGKYF